jgi:N-acetylmuramic acid 6-phosphate etherase
VKLTDRAERIVVEVCGISREDARKYLRDAGGSVKLAIVMQKRALSREAAERALADAGGVIRRVVPGTPPTA